MYKFIRAYLCRSGLQRSNIRFYGEHADSLFVDFHKYDHPTKLQKLVPISMYGGENIVTLLTGESFIGKQAAKYIYSLMAAAHAPIAFDRIELSSKRERDYYLSVMRNRAALFVDIQYDPKEKQKSITLNNLLNTYACLVRINSFDGYRSKFSNVDIMMVLQNNSGDYTKLEYEPVRGIVETLRNTDEDVLRRYLTFMFQCAVKYCRKTITLAHNEAELPKTDGQFVSLAYEIQKDQFPEIKLEKTKIAKLVREIIMQPNKFDMICSCDRYGTALATICSSVCGGAALFSATEIGDQCAIFKPLQTKLSLTDSRELSPYGIVRACVDLLTHLGKFESAHLIWEEMINTMMVRKIKTKEFGGTDTGDFVICDMVNHISNRLL